MYFAREPPLVSRAPLHDTVLKTVSCSGRKRSSIIRLLIMHDYSILHDYYPCTIPPTPTILLWKSLPESHPTIPLWKSPSACLLLWKFPSALSIVAAGFLPSGADFSRVFATSICVAFMSDRSGSLLSGFDTTDPGMRIWYARVNGSVGMLDAASVRFILGVGSTAGGTAGSWWTVSKSTK